MRVLLLAACLFSANTAISALAAEGESPMPADAAAASSKPANVQIRVIGAGWGNADPKDIEAVLQSVAAVMLEHFPNRVLQPIIVAHAAEHPYTLFEKGPAGEYQIFLAANDRRWARFAYEFAHELSHVLANYEHYESTAAATHNQWFEEALCEVASIYALKRLAQVWRTSPPFPHWAEFAPNFDLYAEDLLRQAHRQLPSGIALADWLKTHESELRRNPYLRHLNEIVATLLLPLFERAPHFWPSIGYLHRHAPGSRFDDFLRTWHTNVPDDHKPAIKHVMGLFGVAHEAIVGGRNAAVDESTPGHSQVSHAGPAPGEQR